MAKGNHSFTEQEIRKRFGAIIGHTVAEVDTAGVLTASAASRNKGRIGAVIEQSVLGYPADSDRRPDIVIDGRPWEVKATGSRKESKDSRVPVRGRVCRGRERRVPGSQMPSRKLGRSRNS